MRWEKSMGKCLSKWKWYLLAGECGSYDLPHCWLFPRTSQPKDIPSMVLGIGHLVFGIAYDLIRLDGEAFVLKVIVAGIKSPNPGSYANVVFNTNSPRE